jgi:hypothetical protein
VGPANNSGGGGRGSGGAEGESDVGSGGRGVNGVKGGVKIASASETVEKENEKEKRKEKEDAERESDREKEELKDENILQSKSSESVEINFTISEKRDVEITSPTIAPQPSYNTAEKHEITPNSGTNTPTRNPVSDCDVSQKIGFIKQLEFMHKLTDLVEKLRFVDRALRGDVLCGGLKKMNEHPSALGE